MGYLPDLGEKQNPLTPQQRAAMGRLVEKLPHLYTWHLLEPEFKSKLDGLGTDGLLDLMHSLKVLDNLDKFDFLGLEGAMRVVNGIGGVEYLTRQLPRQVREEIFSKSD